MQSIMNDLIYKFKNFLSYRLYYMLYVYVQTINADNYIKFYKSRRTCWCKRSVYYTFLKYHFFNRS